MPRAWNCNGISQSRNEMASFRCSNKNKGHFLVDKFRQKGDNGSGTLCYIDLNGWEPSDGTPMRIFLKFFNKDYFPIFSTSLYHSLRQYLKKFSMKDPPKC